jgi:hypothetical protein
MRFRRKVDDGFNIVLAKHIEDETRFTNIPLNELIPGICFDIFQVLKISSIGQFVEIHYSGIRMSIEHISDEIAPDETRAARYKEIHFRLSDFSKQL